jgi:hypothetical protein
MYELPRLAEGYITLMLENSTVDYFFLEGGGSLYWMCYGLDCQQKFFRRANWTVVSVCLGLSGSVFHLLSHIKAKLTNNIPPLDHTWSYCIWSISTSFARVCPFIWNEFLVVGTWFICLRNPMILNSYSIILFVGNQWLQDKQSKERDCVHWLSTVWWNSAVSIVLVPTLVRQVHTYLNTALWGHQSGTEGTVFQIIKKLFKIFFIPVRNRTYYNIMPSCKLIEYDWFTDLKLSPSEW